MNIGSLLTNISGVVNLLVVICLMGIGYVIKHTPLLSKISNNLIPIILLIAGIVISLIMGGDTTAANLIVSGIINAAIAIALHQAGKNVFELLPSYVVSGGDTEEEEIEKDLNEESKE